MTPLRWSSLKWMGRSPAHYRYHLDNPQRVTDAMRVGARAHDLVFRSGREKYVTWHGEARRGKVWDAFEAANPGATIMTLPQEYKANEIADAVRRHPEAVGLLFGMECEVQRRWEIAGRECIGTPDAVGPNSIVELKVTNDGSPARFPWHAKRMGWLGQLSWYDYGLFGGNAERLSIIAVEDAPPHVVTIYHLTPDACEFGARMWRSHFERLRVCEDADAWPGYSDVPVELQIDQDFTVHIGGEEVEP